MNSETGPDIIELIVGDNEGAEVLAGAVSDLARRDPRRARHVIESVAASLDEATQGKHTEELEQLEAAALEALGLDAKRLVAAAEKGSGNSGKPEPFSAG